MSFSKILFLFCVACCPLMVKAQEIDTTNRQINSRFLETTASQSIYLNPKKAGLYSALLPGLGQAYNKKYWKIPVLYALGGFLVYQVSVNHQNYIALRDELFAQALITNNTGLELSLDPRFAGLSQGLLTTRKDIFRKNRDRMILFSGLLYAVNILDAVVDAHLSTFTLGDNQKTVQIQPSLIPTSTSLAVGMNVSLNF